MPKNSKKGMGSPRDIGSVVHDLEKDSRVMAVIEPSSVDGAIRVQMRENLGFEGTLHFLQKYEKTIVFVNPHYKYQVDGREYRFTVTVNGNPPRKPNNYS